MNNLLSYCGLVDAKLRASDKDLPVQQEEIIKDEKNVPEEQSTDSEIEEEDWNPDYQSSDFEEADMAPTKGPTFKSKIFFQILLHRLCLIYYFYGLKCRPL
jgi:hypothetical protein